MRKAELIAIIATTLYAPSAFAQTQGDYDAYFGWEDESTRSDEPGPSSLAEARRQGGGYRIGQHGTHTAPAGNKNVHVVQEGDTLWDISAHYFGDAWRWPEVWSYNPEITNPHWIYPLDQVRLTPEQLKSDQALARAGGGSGAGDSTAGMLAGTEMAPSVIVPRGQRTPGSIFLRNEGYLDREALKTIGQVIGGNEEHMMLSPSDQVYVRFKSDHPVRAGEQYAVFREIQEWERDPAEQGQLVRIHGTIVVRSYDAKKRVARGVIIEALDPIERGYYVAKIDRRFDLVPPKKNTATVVAKVIAALRPRSLLSYDNVVFLNVGEGKGIQPGNRFFVVRRGDNWMEGLDADPVEMGNLTEVPEYDQDALPKEVIAELRVVKVRKKTTVAIVTRSDTDIFLGDTAELRPGF
jgi:hypothetical protein